LEKETAGRLVRLTNPKRRGCSSSQLVTEKKKKTLKKVMRSERTVLRYLLSRRGGKEKAKRKSKFLAKGESMDKKKSKQINTLRL